MPRYYFTLTNGKGTCHDLDGEALPDNAAAREHAVENARYLLRNHVAGIKAEDHWRVEIADETGSVLFVIPFGEVARRVEGQPAA